MAGSARRRARAAVRWARLLTPHRARPGLRVFYGWDDTPAPGEPAAGGTAKFQKLAGRFPNSSHDFNVLYLGSSGLPGDLRQLLGLARRRRIPVVVNQDGVGYPGWAGARTDAVNEPLRRALLAADHVLYQSEFCKRSADEFLGEARSAWEVLYNAVDTDRFAPPAERPTGGPVLLLGGDQTQNYRLELGLRIFAGLAPDARLLVTGRIVGDPAPLLNELGVRDRVEFLGRYAQRDAPAIYGRAHVLLHTKVNDPCPNVVLEAMACGLPVVYPASGGTPELVGDVAGIGVPHPDGWERDEPPAPEAMADAVARVLADLDVFSVAARARAVERFAIGPWLDRHGELFAGLL